MPGRVKKPKARDANLGDCSQSCRWQYYLVETTRKNSFLPVEENLSGTSIMSSRDLNLSAHLEKLRNAGIDAFKIEGRMKSIYYVSNVTRVYRHCIDAISSGQKPMDAIIGELENVSHREYTTGFYFKENGALSPTADSSYIRKFKFLGHVLDSAGTKKALIRAMNRIDLDVPIEIIGRQFPDRVLKSFSFEKNGESVGRVQPNDEFVISWDDDVELEKYDILRRKE
jgi:putative protease